MMGRNEDETCADSNGSGKTTLCMAALWALTGAADVRADGKRLGRKEVVHSAGDDCEDDADAQINYAASGEGRRARAGKRRSASVRLCGTLDGVPFEVRRQMSGGKNDAHTLRVKLGGKDLTQSSLRDTQQELERLLPVSVLADSVFHGQHLVTGLLEKTDKDFKTALDAIISTQVWALAQECARERRKEARATREQLVGRILEKEEQEQPLNAAASDSLARHIAWEQEHAQVARDLSRQMQQLQNEASRQGHNASSSRAALAEAHATRARRQVAMDDFVEAMALAQRQGEVRRGAVEAQAKASQAAVALAKSRVALMEARLEELERARQREGGADERVRGLEENASEWRTSQRLRASQASQSLNRALARCDSLRRDAAAIEACHEVARLELVRAVNASIEEMEAAAAQVAACEEAAATGQGRMSQYAALAHEPTCRLCLQPIEGHTHAQHLSEMKREQLERAQALTAARSRFQDAQALRRRAHGLLDGADENARNEERARCVCVCVCVVCVLCVCCVCLCVYTHTHTQYTHTHTQRQVAQREAEDEWNEARLAIAAIELEASPASSALAAARDEHGRAKDEVASLIKSFGALLRDLAGPYAGDSTREDGHKLDGNSGGDAGGRRSVDLALVRARQHVHDLEEEAAVAVGRVAEELQKEEAARADRDASRALARQQLLDASVAVEQLSRQATFWEVLCIVSSM